VPGDFSGEAATFVWIFGMDVDAAPHTYDLSVNGEKWFRFANPRVNTTREWTVDGANDARLHFRVTMIDRHGDMFGYIALRVPVSKIRRGQPLRLRVSGESAGSRVWYMTFQSGVRAGAAVVPQPAIVRQGGELVQPVHVQIVHLGEPETIRLEVEGTQPEETQVAFGLGRNRKKLRSLLVSTASSCTCRRRKTRFGKSFMSIARAARRPPWNSLAFPCVPGCYIWYITRTPTSDTHGLKPRSCRNT
jgi:hypothetical protein